MDSVNAPVYADIQSLDQMRALKSAVGELLCSANPTLSTKPAGSVQPPCALHDGTCVVIGNFDGVHLGHQSLFGAATTPPLNTQHRPVVALTFNPHPRECFGLPHERLLPVNERVGLLHEVGADMVVVLHFSRQLAALLPEAFVQDILVGTLQTRSLVLGYDFVLGREREGSAEVLISLGQKYGFSVHSIPALRDHTGRIISSSSIREMLRKGNVEGAAEVMGRAHRVSGVIEKGFQRGRVLGFPTANLCLAHNPAIVPAVGVYATSVLLPGQSLPRPAVTNIGRNPTFTNDLITMETHVLDFEGNLYDQPLTVYFHHYIRGEIKFNSIDELKAQIQADIITAKKFKDI